METILQNAPPEQQLALPISYLNLTGLQSFEYEECVQLKSGMKIINGIFENAASSFLPVFHDFQIDTSVYADFILNSSNRNCFLAMCGSDGSVIFYKAKELDFNAL